MSIEAIWYSDYSRLGSEPPCRRVCRLPIAEQWKVPIDLAIGFAGGRAGWMNRTISRTWERYWYWPGRDPKINWWLIPYRIDKRVMKLHVAATDQALRECAGVASPQDVVAVLRAWRRRGTWRRHVFAVSPKHGEPAAAAKPALGKSRQMAKLLLHYAKLRIAGAWGDKGAGLLVANCERLAGFVTLAGVDGKAVECRSRRDIDEAIKSAQMAEAEALLLETE